MIKAHVVNQIVRNILVVDVASVDFEPPDYIEIQGDRPSVGDIYDPQTGIFTPPPPLPPEIPGQVSALQARYALSMAGRLADVSAAIAALSPENPVRMAWETNSPIIRNSPSVISIGQQLGLDLDALFLAAGSVDPALI